MKIEREEGGRENIGEKRRWRYQKGWRRYHFRKSTSTVEESPALVCMGATT